MPQQRPSPQRMFLSRQRMQSMPARCPYSCSAWFRSTIQAANQPLTVSFRLGETTYSCKVNADITPKRQGKYYTLSLNIKKTGAVVEGTI